jgi:hypothetical protein
MPNKVLVYKELRPPVAAIDGESPLRNKLSRKVLEVANRTLEDNAGFRVSKEQLIANFTDDGKFIDHNWNRRHHVGHSQFND